MSKTPIKNLGSTGTFFIPEMHRLPEIQLLVEI